MEDGKRWPAEGEIVFGLYAVSTGYVCFAITDEVGGNE